MVCRTLAMVAYRGRRIAGHNREALSCAVAGRGTIREHLDGQPNLARNSPRILDMHDEVNKWSGGYLSCYSSRLTMRSLVEPTRIRCAFSANRPFSTTPGMLFRDHSRALGSSILGNRTSTIMFPCSVMIGP